MPTLEIVSIGAPYSNAWGNFAHVKYVAFPRLISERGVFQSELDSLEGVLLRIGAALHAEACNVADSYKLIDLRQVDRDVADFGHAITLRFLPDVEGDLKRLIRTAVDRSPIHQMIFLSDYQLAGDKKCNFNMSFDRFDVLLSRGLLSFNTMYLVSA